MECADEKFTRSIPSSGTVATTSSKLAHFEDWARFFGGSFLTALSGVARDGSLHPERREYEF
jgi:hypothetical protein